MVLFKSEGDAVIEEAADMNENEARMPDMWTGARTNPMFTPNFFETLGDLGSEHSEDDSLGDLSEFEDADFEAFADSLLDDGQLDEELFGVNMRTNNPHLSAEKLAMLAETDSLSDFEDLDVDALVGGMGGGMGGGYLHMPTESEAGTLRRNLSSSSIGSAISGADSLDLEAELEMEAVVTHATYEDLTQQWKPNSANADYGKFGSGHGALEGVNHQVLEGQSTMKRTFNTEMAVNAHVASGVGHAANVRGRVMGADASADRTTNANKWGGSWGGGSQPPAPVANLVTGAPEAERMHLFRILKKNMSDTTLDYDELVVALQNEEFLDFAEANGYRLKRSGDLNQDALMLLAEMDTNHNGRVSINEFLHWNPRAPSTRAQSEAASQLGVGARIAPTHGGGTLGNWAEMDLDDMNILDL